MLSSSYRIYGVAPGHSRVLSRDTDVLGYSIPAGVINITCHVVMYTTHTVIQKKIDVNIKEYYSSII